MEMFVAKATKILKCVSRNAEVWQSSS